MDILYYSNYCKHSKEILQFLVKHDLTKQLNCLCVDKRKVDPVTGQIQLILENGSTVLLPPNIHSVPALMLLKENYRVISGNAIKGHFSDQVQEDQFMSTQGNGEPMSFSLGSKDVMSESYTMFNASVEELRLGDVLGDTFGEMLGNVLGERLGGSVSTHLIFFFDEPSLRGPLQFLTH